MGAVSSLLSINAADTDTTLSVQSVSEPTLTFFYNAQMLHCFLFTTLGLTVSNPRQSFALNNQSGSISHSVRLDLSPHSNVEVDHSTTSCPPGKVFKTCGIPPSIL